MKLLVIATSLSPRSKGFVLAELAVQDLQALGHEAELVDLRQVELPTCDGAAAYSHQNVAPLTAKIKAADGIIVVSPVYNYDVNSAAKNLIEMTGEGWADKVVGFMLEAGGSASYMSGMGFANSLMLDFRCLLIPRFVYAVREHFTEGKLTDEDVRKRIRDLAAELARVSSALKKP